MIARLRPGATIEQLDAQMEVIVQRNLERLFGIGSRDLTVFMAVPAVLMTVAAAACYVPARRAIRVNPMAALRDS
jgi:ABC-type lipoprotein release transport system permease subunit